MKDLLLLIPPRTWHRQTGGQLKPWATTIRAGLEPLPLPRVLDYTRWRKDWAKVSHMTVEPKSASVRDVVNSIGDAGSTHHR